MRAILLHNPTAGSGEFTADDLLAALTFAGIGARYCSTKEPNYPDVLREPADLIVVAGGDGTVAKAIDHLCGARIPIAILPLGGANNVARSFGIEGDPLEIARAGWRGADSRSLDMGLAVGPWGSRLFLESVGIGALAEAAAAVDQTNVRGPDKSRLARETLREVLAATEPQELRVRIDGHEVEGQFLFVEIMNTASIGPRLLLAPAADPGDGLLDLVCLEADSRAQMLAWLDGPSEDAPPLTRRQGRVCGFEWRRGSLHVGDAFPAPPADPCSIEVELMPDPMTVLVPARVGPHVVGG